MLTVTVAVGAWFYGYYNRKSNDNLPSLSIIAKMDEADLNTLLMGYKRIQLIEVWGEPDSVWENEDIWVISDTVSLRVNSNNKGEVVICGLIGSRQNAYEEPEDDAADESQSATAIWTFSPMMSATWHGAFCFEFELENYTHIEATCDNGKLWNLQAQGQPRR